MTCRIVIPVPIETALRDHLFQNEVEQGCFLFLRVERNDARLLLEAVDYYLVPAEGWEVQSDCYLEMKDSERSRIMKLARDKNLAIGDCHSHPGTYERAFFSPSDRRGILEFAQYSKWKLPTKPYLAMVWAEQSLDAVVWHGSFETANRVDSVEFRGDGSTRIEPPRQTWFHRYATYL